MADPDDFLPCEGEPLRDLTDPYRRAVADADARDHGAALLEDPYQALATCHP